MEILGDNLVAFSGNFHKKDYYCKICDYKCYKKYNWEKHLMTSKHINAINDDKLVAESGKKWQNQIFVCEFCDKEYKYRQGLWRHNKNGDCSINNCLNNDDKNKK